MFTSLVGFGLRPTYILYQYMSSYVRVRIRGLEKLVFREILRMYLMDDPL